MAFDAIEIRQPRHGGILGVPFGGRSHELVIDVQSAGVYFARDNVTAAAEDSAPTCFMGREGETVRHDQPRDWRLGLA